MSCVIGNRMWHQTMQRAGAGGIAAQNAMAQRAELRCGSDGQTLPVEKTAHWRDIERTVDPERTIKR